MDGNNSLDLVIRYHFNPKDLGLPHPFAYYVNLFQGTLETRGYEAQIEEVQDGVVYFARNVTPWIEKMRAVFGIFKFIHETPDWVNSGEFAYTIIQDVEYCRISVEEVNSILEIVNTIFSLYGIDAFLQVGSGGRSTFYFRRMDDLKNLFGILAHNLEKGAFFYDPPDWGA
ncbi:MAG: hypothetical protein ACTSU5_06025 [Promethearchaeota archaeon]